ncbi:heparinase II/III family protein [uncultured Arcticibacterium sp.]|uniref:heparinase II/III domain-containing protein n=1 Tax=uncultured Arcticibacterium sp. TaxID=2173042 RepID=UPI0030FD0F48
MAIFLSTSEKRAILKSVETESELLFSFYLALENRVNQRVSWGSLLGPNASTIWWHTAAEYLSDAAMLYALKPNSALKEWLKRHCLEIVRKSEYDWVGPGFRNHSEPYIGNLETAHLCWGVAATYDLAKDIFTSSEKEEIELALREKGLELCRKWLENNNHLANWRSVLFSGAMVAAVVLEDEKNVRELLPEFKLCLDALQDDGSYGESLQYGNYLWIAQTFAKEAVLRKYPEFLNAENVSQSIYHKSSVNWFATSMLYSKPLVTWGSEPRARAVNFNDSAAIFRPSADVLLSIAVRTKDSKEAGLAYWMFEKYYQPVPKQGPHDLAAFGMVNDWGFLTLPFLTYSLKSLSPERAKLALTTRFSNGNRFARDAWEGKTVLATNGGSEPLHGLGHLHGDLNSFILVHNQERLLVDPGHSCYRNLIHGLESSSQTHNTCTFLIEKESLGLQEDMAKASLLEQKSVFPRRRISNGKGAEKIQRGDRSLICSRDGAVSVLGAEVGSAYGKPIKSFSRLWVLAGSHTLFIIDEVKADYPVTTVWNWVVNNKDRNTKWESQGNSLTVEKGNAAMRLMHGGNTNTAFPVFGFLHDSYHTEPNQLGEGRSGDSLIFRFTENEKRKNRRVVHTIALDEPEKLGQWSFKTNDNVHSIGNGLESWRLETPDDGSLTIVSGSGEEWKVKSVKTEYELKRIK